MWKESLIGGGLALVVYLAVRGVDVTPLLLLGGMFVLFRFFLDGKGGLRRFETVGPGTTTPVNSTVTFADIGGQEVAKREFLEALEFVKDSEKATTLGIRPLRGILLVGPPGTGKTLLAKAAANYTDAAFVAASGSQFVEMYAGVGAQRVRKVFQNARALAERQEKKCAVIFIDEVEVLGGKRGAHHSHLEYDQTLNELLVQMDGIATGKEAPRVLVVAATNRPDLLDPALLRPGRIDRTVKVDLPDREGRLHILKIHSKGRPLAPDVNLGELAKETFGFSGAHLESLVNEAAIHALRSGRQVIEAADFREAIDKVMMGERAEKRPTMRDKERVAYHESGHALVSEVVRPGSVSAITVTPRGDALGYMRQAASDDQYLYTPDEILDQIAVSLGGAVAEEIFLGSKSTGSAGDFEQAVYLAERMVHAGLSELGVVSRDALPTEELHRAVQAIVKAQEERVHGLVMAHRDGIKRAAVYLLQFEKLPGERFRELIPRSQPEAVPA